MSEWVVLMIGGGSGQVIECDPDLEGVGFCLRQGAA